MERACESCGGEDDDLAAVRPLPRRASDDDLELWCPDCRARREHEPAEE